MVTVETLALTVQSVVQASGVGVFMQITVGPNPALRGVLSHRHTAFDVGNLSWKLGSDAGNHARFPLIVTSAQGNIVSALFSIIATVIKILDH